MVALRVALVIAWIVAQVVGVIVAAVVTRNGGYATGMTLPADAALVGVPPLLGAGGLWLAARLARSHGSVAEGWVLALALGLLMAATATTLEALA
jgi:hypothetical protein